MNKKDLKAIEQLYVEQMEHDYNEPMKRKKLTKPGLDARDEFMAMLRKKDRGNGIPVEEYDDLVELAADVLAHYTGKESNAYKMSLSDLFKEVGDLLGLTLTYDEERGVLINHDD